MIFCPHAIFWGVMDIVLGICFIFRQIRIIRLNSKGQNIKFAIESPFNRTRHLQKWKTLLSPKRKKKTHIQETWNRNPFIPCFIYKASSSSPPPSTRLVSTHINLEVLSIHAPSSGAPGVNNTLFHHFERLSNDLPPGAWPRSGRNAGLLHIFLFLYAEKLT